MKMETFEHTCFAGGDVIAGTATACGYVVSVSGLSKTMRRIRVTLSPTARRVFNTVDEAEQWAASTGNSFDPQEVAECRRLTS